MKNGDYFKHKTILITGASSGIGASLAIAASPFAKKLILTGRNQTRLNTVLNQCNCPVETIFGELTHSNVITAIQSVAQENELDIAILNAGTNAYIDADTFQASVFHELMRQNVQTMVDCIEAILPTLLKRNGHLALMSSLAAYGGLPRASAYGASKAAIRNLAQSLNLELRPKGVPVTCICPGFVKTPLTDKNTFEMPFLLKPEKAAAIILKGLEKKAHEIHFPKRFSLPMKCIHSLPAAWQYRLLCKLTKTQPS